MSGNIDPRLAEILRIVAKLSADRDHDGVGFILQAVDARQLSTEQMLGAFASLLQSLPARAIEAMHREAVEQEEINAETMIDMAKYDAARIH